MKHINNQKSGFTIVELLIVIVIIGILAAITIVSYTGITARANTASGQSNASAVIGKANIYNADGPTNNWPSSFGNLTGAPNATYGISGADFNVTSGNKTLANAKPTGTPTDAIDYFVCGVNTSTTAATTYTTVNIITGIKLGYWNYTSQSEDTTTTAGTVSGTYPSGTATISCYKVGIGEAVAAVIKAYYTENGSYPTTLAQVNNNTTNSAKLPAGVTITNNSLTAILGTTQVNYSYAAGVGARIVYWDYDTNATSTNTSGGTSIYIGSAVYSTTFTNPT